MNEDTLTATAYSAWEAVTERRDVTVAHSADSLPTTGFVVGGKRPSLVNPETFGEVYAFVSRVQHADYVGVWVDRSTGTVYVDACDWIVNRGHALGLAARRNELAVYDVAADRAVYVTR